MLGRVLASFYAIVLRVGLGETKFDGSGVDWSFLLFGEVFRNILTFLQPGVKNLLSAVRMFR